MYNLIGILAIFVLSFTIFTFSFAIGSYVYFRIKYAKEIRASASKHVVYTFQPKVTVTETIVTEQKRLDDLEQEQRNNIKKVRSQIKWK